MTGLAAWRGCLSHPTEDDRTRQAAAQAAGTDLTFHDASWQHIQELFQSRNRQVHDSNRRQAFLPASAEVIENQWGTAPGFAVAIGNATFYALPGVPREMRRMFTASVVKSLRQHLHAHAHTHACSVSPCRGRRCRAP